METDAGKILKTAGFSGFTSTELRLAALIAMIIDHIGEFLFPNLFILRIIGRFGFPIFAFLAAEGVRHTHNIKKYILRLFIFSVISEIPYDLAHSGRIFWPERQNVGWTLMISVVAAWIIFHIKDKNRIYAVISAPAASVLCGLGLSLIHADWGFFGPALVIFYIFPGSIAGTAIDSGLLFSAYGFPTGIPAAIAGLSPLIYNGKQGYSSRWFHIISYLFYPVHFMILAFLISCI